MKTLAFLAVLSISLQCGFSQEPFTCKPEDIPKQELPEGLTAEQYIQQVYEKRHYKIKVTFRVVSEDAIPIPNADMNVGVDSLLHADGYNNYKGRTNAEGLFTVESRGQGCTDVLVEKDGYYPSRPDVNWDGDLNPGGEIMHKNGGFRPWNPTINVVLRKVGKPIPMIVRLAWGGCRTWIRPETEQIGKELGWDLVESDWVAPVGNGKTTDLILKFEASRTDELNHTASVRIKPGNPDDGFVVLNELKAPESLLKFPRTAPVDGYGVKDLNFTWEFEKGILSRLPRDMPKGYLFRLRTKKDENGKITSALYGKITKPFNFEGSSKGSGSLQVNFDYYLNPTPNDRNLEYDQKNNLAPEADKDLRWPP